MNAQSRKFILSLLGVALCTTLHPACAQAQASMDAPGLIINLSNFTLQLPGIKEIPANALSQYKSPYFYVDSHDGGVVFECSSDGAASKHSTYPRTELRDNNEWRFIGQHTLTATLAVTQQPSTGDIIVGQIHGDYKGTEALKIRWVNSNILVGVKRSVGATEVKYTLVKGVALNQRFYYTIAQSNHTVTVTVNGSSMSFVYDDSWDNKNVYFKAGNYLQDNSLPPSIGRVEFFALQREL